MPTLAQACFGLGGLVLGFAVGIVVLIQAGSWTGHDGHGYKIVDLGCVRPITCVP